MKAISIHQPYAALICMPESDPRHKRVENRTWPTSHRGPILIHASKTQERCTGALLDSFNFSIEPMPFGAIVAIANLALTFRPMDGITARSKLVIPTAVDAMFPWLKDHQHVEGPVCWVFDKVEPLSVPIAYSGKQGLFDVPDDFLKSHKVIS